MTPRMAAGDGWVIRFEARTGRWVLAPRRKIGFGPWLVVAEWAGVTGAVCAMLAGGIVAGLYQAKPDFDRQSQAFADASVADIATALSPGAVFARASPEFVDGASGPFYADFHRLVALRPVLNEGCRGDARVEPFGVRSLVTARYSCELESKGARAVLVLSLARDLDAWKITGFYVSPPQPIAG